MSKELPARSSRGTRIQKLIGEEAEADEAFWGQAAWNEDEDDVDYITEEEEIDIVDSDFDDEEEPDEDVHDEEEEDSRASRRRQTAATKRVYKEPETRPKRARATPSTESNSHTSQPPIVIPYEAPTLRHSTAKKTSEASEERRKQQEENEKIKRPSLVKTRMTQEQLIIEAVRNEVENTQSLNRLERLEEEKRAEHTLAPKAPYTGTIVRYHSRLGMPKTITFLNTNEFPSIFHQPPAKKRERPVKVEEPVEEEVEAEEQEEEEVEEEEVEEVNDSMIKTEGC